jgi:hypothetical protein
MHENMHQLIDGLNAVAFNISGEGSGVGCYAPRGNYSRGYSGRSQGRGRTSAQGQPFAPNAYGGSFPTGRSIFPTAFPTGGHFQGFMPPRPPQGFPQAPPVGPSPGLGPPPGLGPQPYRAPIAQGSTYVALGMPHAHIQQQSYSNTVKRHSNWNVCYSCGFNVAEGHSSMSCPPYLRKASHDIYFTCQNAQQYIHLGHPCSTKNRHKTLFPTNM